MTPFRLPDTFDSELTLKTPAVDGTLTLGFPNREVKESLSKLYVNAALRSDASTRTESVSLALSTYDVPKIIDFLNRFFNTIDYDHFPMTDEGAVRGIVQAFIQGAGIRAISEKHSSKGRSDLEVFLTGRHIVFEFKYSRREEDDDELLDEAVEEILSRKYGYDLDSRPLLRIAAVFSAAERQLTKYCEVPLDCQSAGPADRAADPTQK